MSVYLKYLGIYCVFGIGFIRNVPEENETKMISERIFYFAWEKEKSPVPNRELFGVSGQLP